MHKPPIADKSKFEPPVIGVKLFPTKHAITKMRAKMRAIYRVYLCYNK